MDEPIQLVLKECPPGKREQILQRAAEQGEGVCGGMISDAPWSWNSEPLPIATGKSFRVRWQCRYAGNRHWNYATKCVGLRLVWLSENGAEVCRTEWCRNVLRAQEWATDWEDATVPDGAAALHFELVAQPGDARSIYEPPSLPLQRFWYGGDELFDGEVWLRNLQVGPLISPVPAQHSRLHVRIRASGTDRPLPARVSVRDAGGDVVQPAAGYFYEEPGGAHPAGEDGICFDLPPGGARLEVRRGFDFAPWHWQGSLRANTREEVTADIQPGWRWADRGWISVDHHCHLHFHSRTRHPRLDVDRVMLIARGEGLNAVSLQGEWALLKANLGRRWSVPEECFVGVVAHEVTSDFYGHLATINITALPELGHPHAAWPDDWEVYRQLESKGGAVVATHPYDPSLDKGPMAQLVGKHDQLSVAREWVIDTLLGARTACDVLSSDVPERLAEKLTDYYRLLNMGFLLGAVGCSDVYIDQGAGVPGGYRTYALAGQADMDSIAAAYRAGATFATNGPLLDLHVDGMRPGAILKRPAGAELEIQIDARSHWGLGRVELLWRGDVVESWEPNPQGNSVSAACTFRPERSGWLALRAFGPEYDGIRPVHALDEAGRCWRQFAHSGPVMIRTDAAPVEVSGVDVDYFRRWIADYKVAVSGYAQALTERADPLSPGAAPEQIDRILRRADHARTALDELARAGV